MEIPLKHAFVHDGKGGEIVFPAFASQSVIDQINRDFVVRDDDLFIVTYPKSGSSWVRQIVHLLVNRGETGDVNLREALPYLERFVGYGKSDVFDRPSPRRYLSHCPYQLMFGVQNSRAKYVYVARNPKDCAVSTYHFALEHPDFAYSGNWDEFFELFIAGYMHYGPWFDHVLGWWQASQQADNIIFLKYEDFHRQRAATITQLADFIGYPVTPNLLEQVIQKSTVQVVAADPKSNLGRTSLQGGEVKHLRKGEIGDWQNYFTAEQNYRFDKVYQERMAKTGLEFIFA